MLSTAALIMHSRHLMLVSPQVRYAGGLRVIIAAVPDSQRSELQLRGRAGRQVSAAACVACLTALPHRDSSASHKRTVSRRAASSSHISSTLCIVLHCIPCIQARPGLGLLLCTAAAGRGTPGRAIWCWQWMTLACPPSPCGKTSCVSGRCAALRCAAPLLGPCLLGSCYFWICLCAVTHVWPETHPCAHLSAFDCYGRCSVHGRLEYGPRAPAAARAPPAADKSEAGANSGTAPSCKIGGAALMSPAAVRQACTEHCRHHTDQVMGALCVAAPACPSRAATLRALPPPPRLAVPLAPAVQQDRGGEDVAQCCVPP